MLLAQAELRPPSPLPSRAEVLIPTAQNMTVFGDRSLKT